MPPVGEFHSTRRMPAIEDCSRQSAYRFCLQGGRIGPRTIDSTAAVSRSELLFQHRASPATGFERAAICCGPYRHPHGSVHRLGSSVNLTSATESPSLSVSYRLGTAARVRWHTNCSTEGCRRSSHGTPLRPSRHPRGRLERARSDLMNSKSNFPLSFDPDAWELSVVAHRPRKWLPLSSRLGYGVNPNCWQPWSPRGFSGSRAGCAVRRKTV